MDTREEAGYYVLLTSAVPRIQRSPLLGVSRSLAILFSEHESVRYSITLSLQSFIKMAKACNIERKW